MGGDMGRFLLVITCSVLLQLSTTNVFAEIDEGLGTDALGRRVVATVPVSQLKNYVDAAAKEGVPVRFAQLGCAKIGKVRIIDDPHFVAAFSLPAFSSKAIMDISVDYYDRNTRRISSWAETPTAEKGIILHELWHAYYLMILRHQNPQLTQKVRARAHSIIKKVPEKHREEIYEEIIAHYVESMLSWYALALRKMREATPERRQELRLKSHLKKHYEATSHGAYEGYSGRDYYYVLTLQEYDRQLVNSLLFENKVSGFFGRDLPERLFTKNKAEATEKSLTEVYGSDVHVSYWFPQKYKQILMKHSRWRTIATVYKTGLDEIIIQKNWRREFSGGKPVLQELTKLSILPKNPSHNAYNNYHRLTFEQLERLFRWGKNRVNLENRVFLFDFNNFSTSQKLPVKFLTLSDDTFVMQDAFIRVVFTPIQKSEKVENPKTDLPFAKTPFGFTWPRWESYMHAPMPLPTAGNYIKQNLSHQRSVLIDSSFPTEFQEAINAAISEWNKALGADVYQIEYGRHDLTPLNCLAERALCLFWHGPREVTWRGVAGVVRTSYDPETGEVLGGFLVLYNGKQATPPTPSPVELVDFAASPAVTRKQIAHWHMQTKKLRGFLHPDPISEVQAVLVHEIGHDNGLLHLFESSAHAANEDRIEGLPALSAMDYLPVIINHRMTALGPLDHAMMNAVYNREEVSFIPRCNDYSETPTVNCGRDDWGDTTAWYLALAQELNGNPFGRLPPNTNLFASRPIIEALTFHVLSPDANDHLKLDIIDWLRSSERCEDASRWLKKKHDLTLSCLSH
jgi:hypothetical protein